MSVESYRESPGEFDSRTLSSETLSRWTGDMWMPWEMGGAERQRFPFLQHHVDKCFPIIELKMAC